LSSAELRRFGFTLGMALGLLASLAAWRGHARGVALLAGTAAGLATLALLAPGLLRPIQRLWMAMAHALGRINTRILLLLAYFLVMTPTGLVMRLVRHDPLDRPLRDRASYWIPRTPGPDLRKSMERHF